jgi:predicted dithiol-disulfide oxidoreductase (DUF899 family)
MAPHKTGTREEWLAARLDLLKAEKEYSRQGDELARRRQELPWVRVDKEYRFDTDGGAVSRAPLAKLQEYKKRMGWTFPWASSHGGDFNFDFNVSTTEEQQRKGAEYNFRVEAPTSDVFRWTGSYTTRIPRMPAALTPSLGCTTGSIALPTDATRRASGGVATTSTTTNSRH